MNRLAKILLTAASIAAVGASPARASLGYQLDASKPSRSFTGSPHGIAVDQASQDIYVAIMTTNPNTGARGEIDRFNSNLGAAGVFASGVGYYTGIAVDPVTHGFDAAQAELHTQFGNVGTPRLDRFSSSGSSEGSFPLTWADSFPQIATDSTGRIFYPNVETHSVQVFSPAGALQGEITCGACPGGRFGEPVSVALNAEDDLFVADLNPDRAVELAPTKGSYAFASTLQSGRGAGAVAVDPGSGDVFVGDLPGGRNYHIVAYNSVGTQFDDFGAGLFDDPPAELGGLATYQIAANATTHKLYVNEYEKLYVFERTTIPAPAATIEPATSVAQLGATLNATVNAEGHAVLSCKFEYTEAADVGFASATSLSCPRNPDGSGDTALGVRAPGLSPATAYRFRVTATSNGGSVTSDSETFETLPAVPPTVTAEPPLAVTQSSATIEAKVNPHGGTTSNCHFEFGETLLYGVDLPCVPLPGQVTTDVTEARKLAELTPTTAYHYRLVVTTNAGTAEGEDVEFTTATPPPPEPPPPPSPTPAPPPPPATTAPPPSEEPTSHPLRCRKGFRKVRVHGKARCIRRKHRHRHPNRR
jgi:hypothetical protein